MEIRSDVRIYGGVFLIILAAFAVVVIVKALNPAPPPIKNFDQCIKAGYPIRGNYPRLCSLPNGKFFVEQVLPVK